MKTILLVEDDQSIQALLGMYLENSGYRVLPVMNGLDVLPMLAVETVDLVVLDINLPGRDGITLCREIREQGSTPIIMLSARWDEEGKVETLENGADDYVEKPFSPRELSARISSIFKRLDRTGETTAWASSASASGDILLGDVKIDRENYMVFIRDEDIHLTKTEFLILEKLAEHPGKVVERDILMKEIIGYDNYLYDRTIDTHIKNLRKKLETALRIETVRGIGYKIIPA